MPATFLLFKIISFGHLIFAWLSAILPTASATATGQASESSSGLHLQTVKRIEQRILSALPLCHLAPALPRPAVCSSAKIARPSFCFFFAYSAAMSFLRDVGV
jgi:hypothetical protein